MPESKSKAVRRKTAPRIRSGILKQFDCELISYDFDIPRQSFDLRKFSKTTGVKVGERWNAVAYPKKADTGYHVHFKGIIDEERVHVTLDYWDGGRTVARKYAAPNAEAIMEWVGLFFKEPDARAMAFVVFEKGESVWKSRFNLPFKVTTSNNLELTIDGVSVLPPRNDFKAFHANISRTEQTLRLIVGFARSVRFDDFDVAKEIKFFNEAVNMFAEQVVT